MVVDVSACVAAGLALRWVTRHTELGRRGRGQMSDRWFYVYMEGIYSCGHKLGLIPPCILIAEGTYILRSSAE